MDTETEEESEQETEKETETETLIIFEEDKLKLLQRFCVYAVKFYIPHFIFMTANIGADAAVNDLSLYKKLKKFRQVDQDLADEALVSEKLEDDDKSGIAARLMSLPRPNKIKFGYPDFPKMSDKTELPDLVTSDS